MLPGLIMSAEQLTLVGALVGGLSALTTALVTMWRKFEAEARQCQEDRKLLWKEIADLKQSA